MSPTLANAFLAIVGGCGLAVLLLIPVAAYQYRRDGRLGLGDLTVMLGAAVYGLALWCYTMLPLPADGYACVGRQLVPGATIHEIDPVRGAGWATVVRDPAFLQVALNLVLFLPLGYYVRRVLGRGIVVATLVGLGVSLTIEVTQASGLWFLYSCAYRLFDVDDLIVNTAGALIGSMLAVLLVRRHPEVRPLPTRITLGRRWVGMACDALFVLLVGSTCAAGYRAWILYPIDSEVDSQVQTALQWGVPGLIEGLLVLVAGRTVGEWVVSLRAVRGHLPSWAGRPVKLLVGVGPFLLLGWGPLPWTGPALAAFVLATLVAPLATPDRRGLSHLASGLRLEIASPPARDIAPVRT